MSDNSPEWFAPKRYGHGAGLPVSWQGWALTLGFVLLTILLAIGLRKRPIQLIAVIIPLSVAFVVISARTTRGGWRWRWGEED
jgi:uncharacterized membrane protein YphA (DoxX/SURF4 family)